MRSDGGDHSGVMVWILRAAPCYRRKKPGPFFWLSWYTQKRSEHDGHTFVASGEDGCREKFEIFNLDMKTGDTLKVKGKISDDTDGFSINLGCSSSDLALHFNPRFNESVIVCNSKCKKAWQEEHRDDHLCFSRGSTIKIVIEMKADKFQVKLPDDHKVEFPNRHCYEKVNYMSVKGGFRVISFKLD